MRLVPDQEPDQIADLVDAYVRDSAPPTADVQLRRMPGGGHPWTTAPRHRFMAAAARALEKAFGVAPVFTREGGSNPLINTFQHTLNVPIVRLDLGLPDDDPHAPNEKLDLRQLLDGIVAAAHFYEALAEV
jgi:amidohydrolase